MKKEEKKTRRNVKECASSRAHQPDVSEKKTGNRSAKHFYSGRAEKIVSLPTRTHWDRENLACRVEEVAYSLAGITGGHSSSPSSLANNAGKQRISSISRLF